jgi:hypothetical protein
LTWPFHCSLLGIKSEANMYSIPNSTAVLDFQVTSATDVT